MTNTDHSELDTPDTTLSRVAQCLDLPERPSEAERRHNPSLLSSNRLAKALLENDRVRRHARAILPQRLRRAAVRTALSPRTPVVTSKERTALRALLADEVALCEGNPRISTVGRSGAEPTDT